MTAETRSSVPVSVERTNIEETLFYLATEHLKNTMRRDVPPQNIVVGIEAFLLHFKENLIIVKTEDSIAMMVGGNLKRIYSAELDSSVEPQHSGLNNFLRTVINLL